MPEHFENRTALCGMFGSSSQKDCLSTVLFHIAETVMYKTADTIDVGVCG